MNKFKNKLKPNYRITLLLIILLLHITIDASTQNNKINLTVIEKDFLNKHSVIRVHNEMNWPPFNFNKKGAPTGYSIDYMNLLADKLGIKIDYISGPNWNDFLGMIKNRDLDVMLNIVKTDEILEYILYTPPYVKNPNVIVSNSSIKYNSIEELNYKKVAVVRGFYQEEIIKRDFPDIKLLLLDNTLDCLKAITFGQADAVLGEVAVVNYIIKENMLTSLAISGELILGDVDLPNLHLGIRNDWPLMQSSLTKAINAVSDEENRAIQDKWFGVSVLSESSTKIIEFTDDEQKWKETNSVIKVGIDSNWAPIEYVDESGQYKGIVNDYLDVLSDLLGITFEPSIGLSRAEVSKKLEMKELDMRSALAFTLSGSKELNFTSPFISLPLMIFARDDKHYIADIEGINQGTTAIVKGYSIADYLESDYPNLNIIEVNNTEEALKAVIQGSADYYIDTLLTTSYNIQKLGYTSIKVVGQSPYKYDLSMAPRNDLPLLHSILEKGLSSIGDKERRLITSNWNSIQFENGFDYSLLWKMAIPTLIIALLFLFWNWQLKSLVKRKTADLIKSEMELQDHRDNLKELVEERTVQLQDANGKLELQNSELHFTQFCIDNAAESVWWIEPETAKITHANLRAWTSLGYTKEEFINMAIPQIDTQFPEESWPPLVESLKQGNKTIFESIHKRKDGTTFPIEISATYIKYIDQEFIVAFTRDITERKRSEEELIKAKSIAEDATKAKGDFLANMSHEIRTPMNAIMGLNSLLSKTELLPKQYDYVEKVGRAAGNLLGIINDILDFSKIEAGKMDIEETDFSLNEVMDNLSSMIAEKVQDRGLELIFNQEPSVPTYLIGDPLRLGQILLNLTNNAVKFTEKGEIEVSIKLIKNDDSQTMLKFEVRDSGIGLTPEQVGKLFKSFSQADTSTSRKYGGTGLGLTISKKLTELMDGEIGVNSEHGIGSTFYFTAKFGIGKEKIVNVTPEDLKGLNVLVVDDNETAREVMTSYLKDFSFNITTVESGPLAIREIVQTEATKKNRYDLVLMDYQMPGMNGIETSKKIKESLENIEPPKIIMVTSFGREDIMSRAQNSGLDGFLIKPVSSSMLFDSIMGAFGKDFGIRNKSNKEDLKPEGFDNIIGAKILLAEDNEINQQVAMETLQAEGFFVEIANNGQDTIDKLSSEWDIILMDIQMPVMDGIEATNKIREIEKYKDLPIVAMTADAMTGIREKVISAGMNDYVTKPIVQKDLWVTLTKWIKPGKRDLPEGFKPNNEEIKSKIKDNISIPAIKGLDIQVGLGHIGGNRELYLTLLLKISKEYINSVKNIKDFITSENMEAAIREAHTIKGVAGNIGATELQNAASIVESALNNNNLKDENLVILDNKLSSLIQNIKQENLQQFFQKDINKEQISLDLLNSLLDELEPILISRKPKPAKEIIKNIEVYEMVDNLKVDFNNLTQFIDRYKIKDAIETLKVIKEKLTHETTY